MSNIVYANPFGAYTEGQSRGLEDAVRAGEASRRFRDSDVNADFMKWYAPLRRQEATTGLAKTVAETGQQQLALNQGLFKNYAGVAALGPGAEQPLLNHLQNTYGVDPNNIRYSDYNDFLRRAGAASGDYPYQFVADPYAIQAGGYGSRRLLPGELGGVQSQQQQSPSFNAFYTATSHIFPGASSAPAAAGNAPMSSEEQQFQKTMGQVNNPYNPESPLYNSGQQASRPAVQQPRPIWADEYKPAGSGGGVSVPGSTNPRVSNMTGGF